MKYSIIVLLEDPHADFSQFVKNLHDVFATRGDSFEILIMANGTGGFLRNQLTKLQGFNHAIKAFEFNTKTTQAVCLQAGLKESSGETIVACGSYQQITNDSFNQLLDALDEGADIISPWRQGRVDPGFNQFQSKIFNTFVRRLLKTNLHDLSCTVKIFRKEVLEDTNIYGNMYRFLPIVAAQKGFKTKEIKCQHFQERGETGFYALSDYVTRLIDIFTIFFNTRFIKKPLRFFSSVGLGSLLIGLFITFYVFVEKFFMGHPVGDRPALLLAIFFIVLGVQAASVGLLGEIITFTQGRHKKEYTIEKKI
ncbi:MAG: glycosyltransferase [Deltaproteobacteria bacterium]|nr:glycosyltransferase [Deltaproteobacteria bacterium]